MKTQQHMSWGPRSASYWLTASVIAAIIFIGARFMVAPSVGAEGFGIPLPQTALAYGKIKGIRDIFSGIIVLIFLCQSNARATGCALAAATIIPISDFLPC